MAGLIVHEWVAPSGGSEKVVEEFASLYPDADIQVLWDDSPGRFGRDVHETWIARSRLRNHKALALPLLPATWRGIRKPDDYDWLLVSSHLFAHHVRLRGASPQPPKLVYAHTPARYIWAPDLDSRGNGRLVRMASSSLKPLDRHRAQEAAAVVANSEFTRERIRTAWKRDDTTVIHPPVDVTRIIDGGDWSEKLTAQEHALLASAGAGYLLGASRFVDYKRLDLVIDAGNAAGVPVVLAGSGPAEHALRAKARDAGVPVTFIARPSDALLFALYQRCRAYVFPAIEDFGIMPVEAMAAGAPVIVAPVGGAIESVLAVDGGVSFNSFDHPDWVAAIAAAEKIDRRALPSRTLRFSSLRFRREIQAWVSTSAGQGSR